MCSSSCAKTDACEFAWRSGSELRCPHGPAQQVVGIWPRERAAARGITLQGPRPTEERRKCPAAAPELERPSHRCCRALSLLHCWPPSGVAAPSPQHTPARHPHQLGIRHATATAELRSKCQRCLSCAPMQLLQQLHVRAVQAMLWRPPLLPPQRLQFEPCHLHGIA